MRKRKGIYQAYDPSGIVTADERWQLLLPDSALDSASQDASPDACVWQIESEVTRIAPFADPRIESFSGRLADSGAGPEWQALAVYTRDNAREAGARFEEGAAQFCWRHQRQTWQREFIWRNDCEIGYNSALFSTVAIWRSRLRPGETRVFDAVQLDHTTFEPHLVQWSCSHRGFDSRDTRFGRLCLAGYEMGPAGAGPGSQFWCDGDGIVYDYAAPDGSGFRLVAVNLKLSME